MLVARARNEYNLTSSPGSASLPFFPLSLLFAVSCNIGIGFATLIREPHTFDKTDNEYTRARLLASTLLLYTTTTTTVNTRRRVIEGERKKEEFRQYHVVAVQIREYRARSIRFA